MHKYLLVFLLFLAGCTKEPPKAEQKSVQQASPAQAETPQFDADHAFGYLTQQTAFGPRNPGSKGHAQCLQFLEKELQQFCQTVTPQPFSVDGYGEKLQLTNIFGSINPAAATRILLLAHWDTRPRSDQDKDPKKQAQPMPGANDGASGVAVLLEVARAMKHTPPPVGVDILFVDGEDYGKEGDQSMYLLGTQYFAQHLPPDYHPAFGILLDMVGDANLELMREPYSDTYAKDIVDLVWSTARSLGVYQFTDREQHAVLDDHLPLNKAGIKTIDLIDFEYPDATNRYWHTTEDTPDKCSAESLEAVGKVLLEVIYHQPV